MKQIWPGCCSISVRNAAPQPADKGEDKLDNKVERTAIEAAKRKFSPEFMNRLDKVVVFRPLRPEQLEQILEIELGMVQQRVLDAARGPFLFRVTPEAWEYLLREGTDLKYGARHLKRAIERHVVHPLAKLLATKQVRMGDMLCIDRDQSAERLTFHKEWQGVVWSVASPQPVAARAVPTTSGRAIEISFLAAVREMDAQLALPPSFTSLTPAPAPANRCKNEDQT